MTGRGDASLEPDFACMEHAAGLFGLVDARQVGIRGSGFFLRVPGALTQLRSDPHADPTRGRAWAKSDRSKIGSPASHRVPNLPEAAQVLKVNIF